MANLDAAHRGYAYQDLLVACKLVDVLLGTIVEASVDEKVVLWVPESLSGQVRRLFGIR